MCIYIMWWDIARPLQMLNMALRQKLQAARREAQEKKGRLSSVDAFPLKIQTEQAMPAWQHRHMM
jgi:hypothetical protein